MLRQRIITALVLVGILFAALASNSRWPFALVTLVLLAAAAWEWGRLNAASETLALCMGAALAGVGLLLLWRGAQGQGAWFWWAVSALWVLGSAWVLRQGVAAWPGVPVLLRWVLGVLLLLAGWLALIQARQLGINFLLSALCLVWMADVAAYFGGRAWGRRKLAVTISPGKSWEGVWSGMAGVLVLAAFWVWLDQRFGFDGPSFYSRLVDNAGWFGAAVLLLALSGLSVAGDLIESLVKRAAGAKDSSQLLPGHGGVLDRVDALLPTLPATLAVLSLQGGVL
jgi:phosphatidate cytidylyltransferase